MNKNALGWLLAVIGVGVIAYFIHRVGLQHLLSAFETAGWGIIILLVIPLFLYVVHAVGWSYTLSAENRAKIGLFRLMLLQTFSYGIAGMLPLQFVLAEPLKLAFLRGTDHDKEDFAASLLVDNTVNGLAIFLVGAAGLVYLAAALVSGVLVKLVIGGIVLVCFALFAGLIVLQKKGVFTGVLNLLGRLRPLSGFRDRHVAQTRRIDGHVRRFYSENRRGFWLSLFYHVLEKAHGVAEFWVIFYLLGIEMSLGNCFFVFAVAQSLENMLFFAQVGGMEAWVSSTLTWMNVTQESLNITVALFRRVRFLFWALVALAMIWPVRRLFAKPGQAELS